MKRALGLVSFIPFAYTVLFVIFTIISYCYIGSNELPNFIINTNKLLDLLFYVAGYLSIAVTVYYLLRTKTSLEIKDADKATIYFCLILFNVFYLPYYWYKYVR